MKLSILFYFLALARLIVNCQRTDDCGKVNGCFLDPENCVNDGCDYIIKWRNRTSSQLDIEMTARIEDLSMTTTWLSIAFADEPVMGNNSAVMCFSNTHTTSANNTQSYYLIGEQAPIVFLPSNPTYGLTNPSITTNNGFLSCRFTRQKSSNEYPLYADTSINTFYILAAYGNIEDDGTLDEHESVAMSNTKVDFNTINVYYGF